MRRRSAAQSHGGGGGGHDGGGSLRWLLTYADMITLLMAFFIMMYSMSVLNLAKFRQVAFSIRSGFGGVMENGSMAYYRVRPPSIRPPMLPEQPGGSVRALVSELSEHFRIMGLSGAVAVRADDRGLILSLVSDNVLFARGESALKPGAALVLDKVAGVLAQQPNQILVEGHTCDLPISTPQYPSNWELSTARATTVVRYFVTRARIPSRRFSVAAYADLRPLVPNDSEGNRARNRRVDIVLLDNL